MNRLKVTALFWVGNQAVKQFREAENGVHRRADFVAHCRKKIAFHAARLLGGLFRGFQFFFRLYSARIVVHEAEVVQQMSLSVEDDAKMLPKRETAAMRVNGVQNALPAFAPPERRRDVLLQRGKRFRRIMITKGRGFRFGKRPPKQAFVGGIHVGDSPVRVADCDGFL